jgi:membrane carboxypeptidase/penicillin-binding protein PbpC
LETKSKTPSWRVIKVQKKSDDSLIFSGINAQNDKSFRWLVDESAVKNESNFDFKSASFDAGCLSILVRWMLNAKA